MAKPEYIALLRGINVSGKNKIRMADLRKSLEEAGLLNIRTYIQTGNILFNFIHSDTAKMENLIKKKIKTDFGYDIPVLVLSTKHLQKVKAGNPFLKKEDDIKKLHVTFLADVPKKERIKDLKVPENSKDDFELEGKTVYLYCPDGYGKTKLNPAFFERKLKVDTTTRNWKTVLKLIDMAGEYS